MSEELKPCPFCGTINELEKCRFLDMIGMVCSIECKKCNDTRVMSLVSMDAAKIKWNTRPAEDALKAENERRKEKLARHRLANMKLRKFINEDLFHVLTRYLPKKQVFSEIIGFLRLKYDHIEKITEKARGEE